jgi:hypothetical protein
VLPGDIFDFAGRRPVPAEKELFYAAASGLLAQIQTHFPQAAHRMFV